MILVIETAIGKGSLALVSDGVIKARSGPEQHVSRAEFLVIEIRDLLLSANVDKTDLTGIAVSVGPGSNTGVRIGISTALGIGAGLGIRPIGASLMHAAGLRLTDGEDHVVVMPLGRSGHCWQIFRNGESSEPGFGKIEELQVLLIERPVSKIIAHHGSYDAVKEADLQAEIVDCGTAMAEIIGLSLPECETELSAVYLQSGGLPPPAIKNVD